MCDSGAQYCAPASPVPGSKAPVIEIVFSGFNWTSLPA
jgi:hypothetical protein